MALGQKNEEGCVDWRWQALGPSPSLGVNGYQRTLTYAPVPTGTHGIGEHRDGSWITVLLQDSIGGLEVRRSPEDPWIPAQPVPSAFIINTGMALDEQSNHFFSATCHRVNVPSPPRPRLSIPFFYNTYEDRTQAGCE